MPKYEDLSFLRDIILNIGNEAEIVENSDQPLNTAPIPDEVEASPSTADNAMEDLLGDELLDDIQQDFNEGLTFDEEESGPPAQEESETTQASDSIEEETAETTDDFEDDMSVDTKLEFMDESEKKEILKSADRLDVDDSEWDQLKEDISLDDLSNLDDLLEEDSSEEADQPEPEPETGNEDPLPGPIAGDQTEPVEPENSSQEEPPALSDENQPAGEMPEISEEDVPAPAATGPDDEIIEQIEQIEQGSEEEQELPADQSIAEEPVPDFQPDAQAAPEPPFTQATDQEESQEIDKIDDENLAQLAGEFSDLSHLGEEPGEEVNIDDALSPLAGDMADFSEIKIDEEDMSDEEDGIQDKEEPAQEAAAALDETPETTEPVPSEDESLSLEEEAADIEEPVEPAAGEADLMADSQGQEPTEPDEAPALDQSEEQPAQDEQETSPEPEKNDEPIDEPIEAAAPAEKTNSILDEDFNLDDLIQPDEASEPEAEGSSEEGGIDKLLSDIEENDKEDGILSDLDSLSLDNLDQLYSDEKESPAAGEEAEALAGQSGGDEKADEGAAGDAAQKGEMLLSNEERKKIILALSALPKEAEIVIAKAILSDKYSDQELKPLIDLLIQQESPDHIIKVYEKITHDKSLAKISFKKFTGLEFEEKQKSFAYQFKKNIYPILSIITTVVLVSFLLLALFLGIIAPRLQSWLIYQKGKELISENKYEMGEEQFERAYEIFRNYNEVVDYARLYREHKKNLRAEKKYEMAMGLKNNRNLGLEVADFYRQTENYEKALQLYSGYIKRNSKDIKAQLGSADTYNDWSKEVSEKLADAKQHYNNVIRINDRNKSAVFSLLDIYIQENNDPKVFQFYHFAENNFKNKVNPAVYANLAEYMINRGEVNEVKNILNSAGQSLAKNENYPEIDYQYGRYKKYLNIINEEKIHLENSLKRLRFMQTNEPQRYEMQKYQKLISKVYNDLGENFEKVSPGDIKALEMFNQSIEHDPANGQAYYNLGNFAMNQLNYVEAKNHYLKAENNHFSNDRLDYNLGWLRHREQEYYQAYKRIKKLHTKFPDNNHLKFMIGTILYKMEKFDLSESMLLETYQYFNDLKQFYYPLEMDIKEDRIIADMLTKTANNLGAAYQKKYEKTRNSNHLIYATKYYGDSIELYDKLIETPFTVDTDNFFTTPAESNVEEIDRLEKKQPHINLRMVLYPYSGKVEPLLFDNFPFDYEDDLKNPE